MIVQDFPIHATAVRAISLEHWYEQKLGLVPERNDEAGAWHHLAADTWLYLYGTASAGTARNTIAGWTVTGDRDSQGRPARGVVFEE